MADYIQSKEEKEQCKTFGEKIASLRKKKSWTQEKLAEEMGYGEQTISNWENGLYFPKKFYDVIKLAELLKCDVDHLIGKIGDSTHDVQFVHDFTGLSEEAINRLSNSWGTVLSKLIETDHFYDFMQKFFTFDRFVNQLTLDDLFDEEKPWHETGEMYVSLSKKQAIDHFKQEVAFSIVALCEELYKRRVDNIKNSETEPTVISLEEVLDFMEHQKQTKKKGKKETK